MEKVPPGTYTMPASARGARDCPQSDDEIEAARFMMNFRVAGPSWLGNGQYALTGKRDIVLRGNSWITWGDGVCAILLTYDADIEVVTVELKKVQFANSGP